MYRKLFPVALVALFSFALIGCEEDPLSPDNPTMKAEVDGTEKETTSILALKTSQSINITGTFSDGTGITLQLPIIEAPKTFDLETDVTSNATYNVTSPLGSFLSDDGEIKVESISETGITGTFSFTGTKVGGSETVEITDGSFSAKFQ